jgi:carbonic anhydrase
MKREVRFLLTVVLTALFAARTASQSSKHHENAKAPSADQIWSSLVDGNTRFVDGKPAAHDLVSQRRTVEKNQHPPVAVLSCSDSRVPPEVVFDQGWSISSSFVWLETAPIRRA